MIIYLIENILFSKQNKKQQQKNFKNKIKVRIKWTTQHPLEILNKLTLTTKKNIFMSLSITI